MSGFFKLSPEKILEKQGIKIFDKQREILKSVNDYKVTICACTRRGGKSMLASASCCAKLLEPMKYIGLLSPNMSQTDIIFQNVVSTFTDSLNIKPTKLNNKDRNLVLDWGSEIRANTLRNRKAVAGRAYDLFVGDEIALAEEETSDWLYQEVLPATVTTKGSILIISTPRGMDGFFQLWEAAEHREDWNRVHYTIFDCEHIPKSEIKKMEALYKEQNMEKMWAQEFLSTFLSFSGAVFNFQPQIVQTSPDPDLIVTAVDPGTNTGFIKCHINKKHGVFVTFTYEEQSSSLDHGKMLQKYTDDADLNVYDHAAKQFAQDMVYEFDLSLTKANKAVEEGINFLRRLEGKLFVLDTVDEVFLREWSLYSMKNDKIVKKHDHTIDCIRMALFTAYTFWPEYFPFLNNEVESLWE